MALRQFKLGSSEPCFIPERWEAFITRDKAGTPLSVVVWAMIHKSYLGSDHSEIIFVGCIMEAEVAELKKQVAALSRELSRVSGKILGYRCDAAQVHVLIYVLLFTGQC